MKNYSHKGYTLIELMIVIAIIGILVTTAIPIYYNYMGRAQVTEGITATSGLRNDIAAWLWEKKTFPDGTAVAITGNIGQQAYDLEGKYIRNHGVSVTADTGVVTIEFDSGVVANKNLVMTPIMNTDTQIMQWQCSGSVGNNLLPASCL